MQDLDNVLDINTPLAVVVVDANGVILHINRWMADWSGHTPGEVAGMPFEHLYPEVLTQGWPFGPAAGAPKPSYIGQVSSSFKVLDLPDVFVLHIATPRGRLDSLLCFPHETAHGEPSYALFFYDQNDGAKHHRDYARAVQQLQRVQLERHAALLCQLEHTTAQLMQNEKMAGVGQLAAGVAHEINNPIGYVFSNLKTLESYMQDMLKIIDAIEHVNGIDDLRQLKRALEYDYIRNDIEDLISESEEGVERVKSIIAALKYFSYTDDDTLRSANLNDGIKSTLLVAGNEIKYKANVVTELGDIPNVMCSVSQINQVVMNLLMNALQAITNSGTITIRSGHESTWVWFEIEDTGVGISPDIQRRMFDPFFTTKPAGLGTGLGLSLSFNIVKKHHGRIDVVSTPGKGTKLRVWLPVNPEALPAS
ncbi:ATP-binding protein [Pusillimonas sp. NJUB218]|uniref:ATP-binding protein n=1 Tax=Pusillimonas sp. NJUB218 TaxID=2023230 RepID=UPI000F4BCDF5|nr:ATP-binding protein [Pusillimonas sp. NJUB218]ROT45284.1 hypothetical protein CHR62_08315 [Pusillimonas sp. NJUB218]